AASPAGRPPPRRAATGVGDRGGETPGPGPEEPVEPGLIGGPAPGGRTSVLVGYGPRSVTAKRRPRKAAGGEPTPTPSAHPMFAQPPVRAAEGDAAHEPADTGPGHPAPGPAGPIEPAGRGVVAKPPVRPYARDGGGGPATATPPGPHGTIAREDVESAARARAAGGRPGAPATAEPGYRGAPTLAAVAAFDPATRERRIPVKGVRKHTAAAMVASAFTAPHVTE